MRESRFLVLPLATFGLLLTGCAVPSHTATPATVTAAARVAAVAPVVAAPVAAVAAPDPNAKFLAAIRAAIPPVADAPDADLLAMGNNICGDLTADGASVGVFDGIVRAVTSGGVSSGDAGHFIAYAVGYLCPQFTDAATGWAAG
jgi:hypothetical protein